MDKTYISEEVENEEKASLSRRLTIKSDLHKISKKINFFTICAWFLIILGFIIALITIVNFPLKVTSDDYNLNLLGDFLSGTVALTWSLAGLFFIYIAFLGQKQQMLHQQIEILISQLELKYTRFELAGQKAELAQQNETLKLQKFENTFFQLITLFNTNVNSFDLRSGKEIINQGRDCLKSIHSQLILEIRKIEDTRIQRGISFEPLMDIIRAYETVFKLHKSDLSLYYKSFYHLLIFVEESRIEKKKEYFEIIKSQISDYEQALLFYHSLNIGKEKIKPFIEKYTLFKDLDSTLIYKDLLKDQYKDSSFIDVIY